MNNILYILLIISIISFIIAFIFNYKKYFREKIISYKEILFSQNKNDNSINSVIKYDLDKDELVSIINDMAKCAVENINNGYELSNVNIDENNKKATLTFSEK